jgi:hypothetical protein
MCSALNAAVKRVANTTGRSIEDVRGAYDGQVRGNKKDLLTIQKTKATKFRNFKAIQGYGGYTQPEQMSAKKAANEAERKQNIKNSFDRRFKKVELGYGKDGGMPNQKKPK